MASLNINSLLAHIDDLRIFVTDSKIEILAINETKLDSSIGDSEISLPGFEVVRRDRPMDGRCGGGVCIYRCFEKGCLTIGERLTRQCRKSLWVMVVLRLLA